MLALDQGIAGTVVDLLGSYPVNRAAVAIAGPATIVTLAGPDGRFSAGLDPGSYELQVSAPGYLTVSRTVAVEEGRVAEADFALLLENPTDAQQDLIYAKTIQQPQWPAPGDELPEGAVEVTGAAVVVPETIVVRFPDGSQTTMAMDDYLRHVVPAEMPPTWPLQSLRAQAVAARSYAVAYVQSRGYICTTVYCQAYGANTYASSDQAVYSTHGQIATYNGGIITAVYFAQCDGVTTRNSEQAWSKASYGYACATGGWNYAAYLRAAPCSGHARYAYNDCGYHGHGVGMCQWGARDFGNRGWSHDQILRRYYAGIQVTRTAPQLSSPRDGHMQLLSAPLALQWSGGSEQYQVTILGADGRNWSSGWIGGLAYSPGLPAGSYTWRVAGETGGSPDGESATWRFTLATNIYSTTLANVKRNSD